MMVSIPSFKTSFFVFVVGAFFDGFTTIHMIKQPSFIEGNPLVSTVLSTSGVTGLFILKLVIYACSIGILLKLGGKWRTEERLSLMTLVFGAVWVFASVWNSFLFYIS